jgi:hypothetical protein
VDLVQAQGLRLLTSELITERINFALANGHLSEAEAASLRSENVFATGRAGNREGQICLVVGREAFDLGYPVDSLLSLWGR